MIAAEMFPNGNLNWGWLVALFYFASGPVLEVLCAQVPEVRTILGWTGDFPPARLLGGIQDQGRWDGLLSSFGTPMWPTVTILMAGVLTASLTVWKMGWDHQLPWTMSFLHKLWHFPGRSGVGSQGHFSYFCNYWGLSVGGVVWGGRGRNKPLWATQKKLQRTLMSQNNVLTQYAWFIP